MKITPSQLNRFLLAIPSEVKIFFLHGSDLGLLRACARRISTMLGKPEAMVYPEQLAVRTLTEMALHRHLFEPDPCLVIENPQDHLLASLKALSPYIQHCHPIIILALEPPVLSGIKSFCQSHAFCAAIVHYRAPVPKTVDFIRQQLKDMEIQDAALAYLVHHGSDAHPILVQDLEKLRLYKMGHAGPLTLDEVKGVCAFHDQTKEVYTLADTLFESIVMHFNNPSSILPALQACLPHLSGVVPVLSYHFQRLLLVQLMVEDGVPFDRAVQQLMPPLHFLQLELFRHGVKNWSMMRVHSFLGVLFEADYGLRSQKWVPFDRLIWELCVHDHC